MGIDRVMGLMFILKYTRYAEYFQFGQNQISVFNNSILNALKDGNHFAYINIDSAIITRRSSMVNERTSSLFITCLSNFDIGRFNVEQRKVMAKDLRGGR